MVAVKETGDLDNVLSVLTADVGPCVIDVGTVAAVAVYFSVVANDADVDGTVPVEDVSV